MVKGVALLRTKDPEEKGRERKADDIPSSTSTSTSFIDY